MNESNIPIEGSTFCPVAKPTSDEQGIGAFFRGLVILSTFSYLVCVFSPWLIPGCLFAENYDLLAWDGRTAAFTLPAWIERALVALWIAVAVGLWRFNRWARGTFLALTVLSLIMTALGGMDVRLAFEAVLEDAVALIDGVILALAYFSPLKEKFAKRCHPLEV